MYLYLFLRIYMYLYLLIIKYNYLTLFCCIYMYSIPSRRDCKTPQKLATGAPILAILPYQAIDNYYYARRRGLIDFAPQLCLEKNVAER